MEAHRSHITEDEIVAFMPLIRRLARRMKRTWHSADVAVLESAGFFALVKAARNWRGENGCKFSTYLFTCVRYEMLRADTMPDGHHAYWKQSWLPLTEAANLAHPAPSPLAGLIGAQRDARVAAALDALKPKHREVLRLVFFDGLGIDEVAQRWGVKYFAAYKVSLTAKRALAAQLRGEQPYRRKRLDAARMPQHRLAA